MSRKPRADEFSGSICTYRNGEFVKLTDLEQRVIEYIESKERSREKQRAKAKTTSQKLPKQRSTKRVRAVRAVRIVDYRPRKDGE